MNDTVKRFLDTCAPAQNSVSDMLVEQEGLWNGDDCSCDYFDENGEHFVTRNFDEVLTSKDDLLRAREIATMLGMSMDELAALVRRAIQNRAAQHHILLVDAGFSKSEQCHRLNNDYCNIIALGIRDAVQLLDSQS